LSCAKEGQMGCESNGGHSVSLSAPKKLVSSHANKAL
jgi:hypothetical protein